MHKKNGTLINTGTSCFNIPLGNAAGVDPQNVLVRNLHVSSLILGFLLSKACSKSSMIFVKFVY